MSLSTTGRLLTPADAARLASGKLSPAAFKAAAARGRLRVAALTTRGIHLFEQQEVEAFLAERERRGPRARRES